MLRLYHSCDARSLRCLWLLHEMGRQADVDVAILPFPPRTEAPDFLKINPQGTVPALTDGYMVMTESVAIMEYLMRRLGPTPLAVGADEPDYGLWLDWLHYGEASLLTPQVVMVRYRHATDAAFKLPQVEEDHAGIFLQRLDRVTAALSDRAFLCAGRFTAADISVGYALDVANYLGLTPRLPDIVRAYVDRLRQRAGYRAARHHQQSPSATSTIGAARPA